MKEKNTIIEITLEENLGQLVEFDDSSLDISALGYAMCNKYTGISLLEPTTVLYNGEERSNPAIIKNEHDEITEVYYKCVAEGYAPNGKIVVMSSSLSFRPNDYLKKDLISVISRDLLAGKITKEKLLSEKDKLEGYWVPYLKNELVIWANLNHPDIIKVFEKNINNVTFAERTAQTFCKRNALKQHPALSNLLTNLTGEVGYRKAVIKLEIPPSDNLTRDQLMILAEGETNIKFLDDVVYQSTELLTSSSMLGLPNENDTQSQSNNDKKGVLTGEKEDLLSKLKTIDKATRNSVFKDFFPFYNSFGDLNESELKFIIKKCTGAAA